jgi:hypothetical protein
MREKIIDAAKRHLDAEGIPYRAVFNCEKSARTKSKSWTVGFERDFSDGFRVDPSNICVLVNSETLEAEIVPLI